MKRWLTKLVVFLLLGAIVNVAVAWGCSVLLIGMTELQSETIEGSEGSEEPETWLVAHAWGFEYIAVTFTFDLEAMFGRVLGRWLSPKIDPQPRPRLDWSTLRSGAREEAVGLVVDAGVYAEAGAGWPLKSLGYRIRVLEPDNEDSAIGYDWGLSVEREEVPFDHPGRILPLRPLWPGFAINTILCAAILAILWLLTLGPFTARRMIRRKRGHCIKCGYDLRGTEHEVCPECGQPTR